MPSHIPEMPPTKPHTHPQSSQEEGVSLPNLAEQKVSKAPSKNDRILPGALNTGSASSDLRTSVLHVNKSICIPHDISGPGELGELPYSSVQV